MRPVVGVVCCRKAVGPYETPNQAVSETYIRAVGAISGAVAVLIPADPASDVATLLGLIDGLLLTGSLSNVEPSLYGGPAHPAGTLEDRARDRVTMAMTRGAVEAGLPVLAICRGLQELNVAFGGTLHQRLADRADGLDHAAPEDPDVLVRTGKRHSVETAPGGMLRGLGAGAVIEVNSLHDQGIARLAEGLSVEARAPDGTIEAVRLDREAGGGWVLGVQWHPEYDHGRDPVSRAIFARFGDAMRARRGRGGG